MKKKLVVILLVALPILAKAQSDWELRVSGGYEFIGIDPWLNGSLITGTLFYNISGIVAMGPSFTQGIGNNYYVDNSANNFETSLQEIALITQFTFLRKGKFKAYGDLSLGLLKAETKEPVVGYLEGEAIKDETFGVGFGVGSLLYLGSGVYWNILEYRMRTLSSDFMDMEKGFQGSIGPMHAIRTGISISL
ncbi:MAG: outer membrane beta-barrel protein [Fulvivirga sp.]|nr:outer membrane beta-barrel protein [Fulvivirga sp.]